MNMWESDDGTRLTIESYGGGPQLSLQMRVDGLCRVEITNNTVAAGKYLTLAALETIADWMKRVTEERHG
jgi:hypothetical protein